MSDLFIVFWLVSAITAGIVVQSREGGVVGFVWLILGVLLGPVALIVACFTGGKQCPYCVSRIHKQATVCPRCQRDLPEEPQKKPTGQGR